jgi:aryl-phospho-beta-D-glucosidase BglC (GH1 family)
MTQYQDRKNMIIANSITQNNDVLIETNSILGNDIVYDWINYTTTVGIDYFSYIINGQKREYDIENLNNQMIYPIKLLQPSVSKFVPYKSSSKE